jgi:hypothetical protein
MRRSPKQSRGYVLLLTLLLLAVAAAAVAVTRDRRIPADT